MKKYVLGFYFKVVDGIFYIYLIKKKRPIWQQERYNGIGGKIEENETPENAIIREFQEETGLFIENWNLFCELTDDINYKIYCYYNIESRQFVEEPKTITDEIVSKFTPSCLPMNIISNIRWLIPMALSFKLGESCKSFVVKEIL
jgi:8-oxo-dGTP diphosphatase